MKAIIENKAENSFAFLHALDIVLNCKNETELREASNSINNEFAGLKSGFGSSHFWVSENGTRVIFVEF